MIDLRSDTLTLPTAQMLQTILTAPLGDDGRADREGRGEDPSVNHLEDEAAALFGKEAAVFFPSGTLANTAALLTWANPGQQVLIDPLLHIVRSEQAAFSARFGQLIPLAYEVTEEGKPSSKHIEELIASHSPTLLILENTHNFRGGLCLRADEIRTIAGVAQKHGIPVHMDGARIFNAAASTGESVQDLCKDVDSVMFCLSKGLGAPMGSLVVCTRDFSQRLRKTKKFLGGSLRQAGIAAAPGRYALSRHLKNALEDNQKAALFAGHSAHFQHIRISHPVQSNIVMLETKGAGIDPDALCQLAKDRGLHIRPVLDTQVRLVFHQNVSEEDAIRASGILSAIDAGLGSQSVSR